MPNTRTILISLDHLVSEIAAYPFSAVEGLVHGNCVLDPALRNNTAQLWRDAERYLTSRFPHTSIDELVSLRNLLWFGDGNRGTDLRPVALGIYLERLAASYLAPQGPTAVPKLPDALHGRGGIASGEAPAPTARRAWRWLTFALPADLLLAGLRVGAAGPVRVEVVSRAVEAVLLDGFAETHLHFGIAFDFSMAWAATVNLVGRTTGADASMQWDAFGSPGAAHDEGLELAGWLIRAAIVRYLLAAYLQWGHNRHQSFRRFLNDSDGLGWILSELLVPVSDIEAIRSALRDLQALNRDSNSVSQLADKSTFLKLQSAYNRLTRVSTQKWPDSLDAVQQLDPLACFYNANSHTGPSVQLQFLWAGLQYLESRPDDVDFGRLFWQVERIRCQVYRHCIQRPLTPGLTNFIRFYDRKKAVSAPLDKVVLESAGVLGGLGRGLKSLEIRTSPNSNRDSQRKYIRSLQKKVIALRQEPGRGSVWQQTECGLVLHFLKFRGKQADRGEPQGGDVGNHADPRFRDNTRGYRWQRFMMDRRREVSAMGNAVALELELHKARLPQHPFLLNFLCGIDVCRDEAGVPTWVVAPLFHDVRRRINATRAEWLKSCGIELPPLHTTAHVGEDFVHLASGVRYMDEALKFLPLGAGDRVGHGLALGVEPLEWARRSTRLAMPREDRWFDLVWERHWHADSQSRFTPARRVYVEDEIVRLTHRIFDPQYQEPDWTVQQAIEFVCKLHDFDTLQRLGFPDRELQSTELDGIERHLERYLTSPSIYQRCRTVEWVESGQDGKALAELQRLVRQRFAELGITIEVNPISNLLVGDLSDLESHPLWRLAPGLGHNSRSTLRMCVGSDDPFPFATTLPEEYQFLFDSFVLAGKSQAEARAWLDMIRKLGWESRFTRQLPLSSVASESVINSR